MLCCTAVGPALLLRACARETREKVGISADESFMRTPDLVHTTIMLFIQDDTRNRINGSTAAVYVRVYQVLPSPA